MNVVLVSTEMCVLIHVHIMGLCLRVLTTEVMIE